MVHYCTCSTIPITHLLLLTCITHKFIAQIHYIRVHVQYYNYMYIYYGVYMCLLLLQGYNEANSYIATQGPIPSTFGEFWRMLWEYDVPTIVMVTNLKEDEKVCAGIFCKYLYLFLTQYFQIKCHQYWPSYGATNYGDFQVTLKEVENIVDYGIRTFQIQPVGVVNAKICKFTCLLDMYMCSWLIMYMYMR